MAKTLTITINDDDKYVEIRDCIVDVFANPPYTETVEDPNWVFDPDNPDLPGQVPNPVSKDEYFKKHVIDILKSQYNRAKRSVVQRHPLTAIDAEDLTMD